MMDFNDLKLTDKKETVFLPSNLRYKFSEVLAEKRPDIEQESIGRMSIIPGSPIYEQRKAFYDNAQRMLGNSIAEMNLAK